MASSAIIKLYTTVKDNVGRIAKTAVQIALANYDPSTGLGAAWKLIIEHLINSTSTVVKQSTAQSYDLGDSASSGARDTREDKVTVDLPDSNGTIHTFRLPTPSVDLAVTMGSDKLNITNTLLLAWVSAMFTNALTPDGESFTGQVTGGRFIRHKSEKKGGY